MRPYYREITYRAWGLGHHERVQGRADELAGVEVLLARARPLGWLERDRLFATQYACRVVLAVAGRGDEISVAIARGVDPYRTTFRDFIREVRPDVARLIEDIGGEHREIDNGRLAFATKAMAMGRASKFRDRFVPFAKAQGVKLECSNRTGGGGVERIEGRAFGSILGIHRLSYALLGSPFVLRPRLDVQFE